MEDLEKKLNDIEAKLNILIKKQEKFEHKQDELTEFINDANAILTKILNDMYEFDGESYKIVCPYCENEFSIDLDEVEDSEIRCPECENVIQLDLHDGCGCGGCDCGDSCSHDCHDDDDM